MSVEVVTFCGRRKALWSEPELAGGETTSKLVFTRNTNGFSPLVTLAFSKSDERELQTSKLESWRKQNRQGCFFVRSVILPLGYSRGCIICNNQQLTSRQPSSKIPSASTICNHFFNVLLLNCIRFHSPSLLLE